ncbi:hypothetical protein ALQ47_100845 [Pseudomonas cichorii]|uniref:Uncharacterized protein n=1 Tax=Pseudomonas cichorii TaxID=36746 RepID=A0A3M4LDW1_PSECI|nr:hypothetical protein ALQ47_100845 [Pseudomonas cichorii]RMQ39680.1 hypothetical protein ALQ04_100620 [Pseudomonas cichorii]
MVFRRGCFSHPLSLLMSAFALLIPPASFSTHLHRLTERSSTASPKGDTRSFGAWFEPRYIFRAGRLD